MLKLENNCYFLFFISYILLGGKMLLSSLQEKDVINLFDGKKIGIIIDASVDKNGKIIELSVQKKRFFFFSSSSTLIKWNQIDKIGKDVILVNVSG